MYDIDEFMLGLENRNRCEPEFISAVREVVEDVRDELAKNGEYRSARILERLTEPDRSHVFKVEWEDADGSVQVNRGFRVQFNGLLGPYKGGLRFHSTLTLGHVKALAFEQIFKNSLTMLPMGGAKGGSDFSPKGKTDNEVKRFCNAFMSELQKYIGPETDVPAGDVGVGGAELGYMYGQYKRLRGVTCGVLTGKGLNWGGSLVRPEATGFGAVYYADHMLEEAGESLAGKRVAVSGFGNVAWGVAIKASQLGARVITLSGPDGYILDEEGVGTKEKWDYMLRLRTSRDDVIFPYAERFNAQFFEGRRPWEVEVDLAFPCAIEHELDEKDAANLVTNGCGGVVEVSNMGCTPKAVDLLQDAQVGFAPGKAANAGGVAVSGFEMAQNSMKLRWSAEEVEGRLQHVMKTIHEAGVRYGRRKDRYIDYVRGSNIAGFRRVADAMLDLGYY